MKDNVRVLFPFVGDTVGGSHISALTLAKALPSYGVEPVVAVHQDGLLKDYLHKINMDWVEASRVPVVRYEVVSSQLSRVMSATAGVVKFLFRNKIDIVHTNDLRMHCTWVLGAKLAGAKMVWHQRSASFNQKLSYYPRIASQIITISRHCKESLPEVITSRAHLIPSPVYANTGRIQREEEKKKIQARLGVPQETLLIAWVANWMERKRPLVFVDMAAKFVGMHNGPVAFLMFGEAREPMRDRVLERIKAYGLEEKAFIMGLKTPIDRWIAGCDVLAATAVNEPLGRTLIEAMLAGTPVVATAHGGHLEIIEDGSTGMLVPPDDPNAMAEAIFDLSVDAKKLRKITSGAQIYAKITYSVERHVEKVLEVYGLFEKVKLHSIKKE